MVEKHEWACSGRVLAAIVFALAVVVCIAVAVVVLLTQNPVNLGLAPDAAAWDTAGNGSVRRKPAHYDPFTFEELVSSKQHVRTYYATQWLSDDSLVLPKETSYSDPMSFLDGNSLMILRPGQANEELFISESEFISGFTSDRTLFSSNGKYVALFKIVAQGFRHSQDAIYQIARLNNGKLTKFTFVGPEGTGKEQVSDFKWNPNPEKNDFIFVYNFNLYYQADPDALGSAIPLSENGKSFYRYGISDWLYEEEIFSSANALWWSPKGENLAYMRFDDQYVNRVYVAKYFNNRQYVDYMEVPYPKAGVSNQPEVTLYLWNKEHDKKVVISPPDELGARNMSYYILSNNWLSVALNGTREERLLTVWADREQMNIYLTLCSIEDCVLTFSQSFEINDRALWAEPDDFQTIISSPSGFFVVLPHQYTDGNIYNHVAHVRVQDDGSGRVTTFHGGTYDVVRIHGYEPEKDTLFYESSGGGIAFKRLFRVRNASTRLAQVQCISCTLPNCDSSSISVSPKGTRAALTCKPAFENGRLFLLNTANQNDFQQLRGFDEALLGFDVPSISHEKLLLSSGIEAHVGIMKPPKFDSTENYPVLLNVYGGPNSYMNSLETPWDFLVYLCTTRQVIIVYVDGRGSKHRGWDVKEAIRHRLGGPEVDDQIDAMRLLVGKNPYMDKRAVAVLGWSYGGFLSTHIAVRDRGHTFRCALAVAPVADFSMYDSAYTERYLGLPSENPKGYNSSRLTDKMTALYKVNYLLAHGGSDDNVHYQHSALLAGALQESMIAFTQLVYTNQDHSMVAVRPHLYRELTNFLDTKCFSEQYDL